MFLLSFLLLNCAEFIVDPVLGLLLCDPLLPLLGDLRGEVVLPVPDLPLPDKGLKYSMWYCSSVWDYSLINWQDAECGSSDIIFLLHVQVLFPCW